MYTPIYDVAQVIQLIEHRLCWFRYDNGDLELAYTWFERERPRHSPMFEDMVLKGKYGIMLEE